MTQTVPPEPQTQPTKSGDSSRRDNGQYVQDGANEWTIILPAGPNGGLEMSDTAGSNWTFDCGDNYAGVVVNGTSAEYTVTCDDGNLSVNFAEGYPAGDVPVVTIRATILTDFEVGQEFDNVVNVRVRDYVADDWGDEEGWSENSAETTWTQTQSQGGSGEVGEFLVSIGDYVWYDENKNGVQDEGPENAIAGVVVTLYDAEGNVVDTAVTDENGYYWFTDLLSDGEYYLIFEQPEGYDGWTTQDSGDDDATDSDVDPVTGRVDFTAPSMGANEPGALVTDNPTLDAGLVRNDRVSIGDYVWFDENRDGLQGDDEEPIGGVVVNLYDAEGNLVGTTETDETGYYNFKDLYPSTDYYLVFEKPDGYTGWTTPDAGDDAFDSDVNEDGRVDFTTPESGENQVGPDLADNPTLDAGLVRVVSIGDYVWYDRNRDGLQGDDETPIAGVVVNLYDAEGNLIGTTETDENGYYNFQDLNPSTDYYLIFEKPDGYAGWTTQDAGDDALDSDVDENGRVDFTTPEFGNNQIGPELADNPTLDAGLIRLVSVGDYVWYDTNKDGIQDPDEEPASGIVVRLFDEEGILVGETTTDENGFYNFKDLEPGTNYKLVFEKPEGYD